MTSAQCSTEGCIRPVYATDLCKPCYMRVWRARTAGPPASERHCANPECGQLMVNRVHRDAMYCSPRCKEAAHLAPETRPGLVCSLGGCENPIPKGRAKFCSKSCLVTFKNRERSRLKAEAKIANRQPCANPKCGKPIPEDRTGAAIYCSKECSRQVNGARWNARNPHYMRSYLYGVPLAQWDAKMAEQDGRCAICRSDGWPGKDNAPHLDHDGPTRRFRGILCSRCNNGLGNFLHDPVLLRAAADYMDAAISRGGGDLPWAMK